MMAFEPETVVRFMLLMAGATVAILWVVLPFAIFGIKKRLKQMHGVEHKLFEEIVRLRKTLETLPGATQVGRRRSNLGNIAGPGLTLSGDREADIETDEPNEPILATPKTSAKSAVKSRDNPASLIEQENLDPEGDEEYGDLDDCEDYGDVAPVSKPKGQKTKKKPALPPRPAEDDTATVVSPDEVEIDSDDLDDDEEFADDSEDIFDESLEDNPELENLREQLLAMPMKSRSAKGADTKIVVDIPPEDEILEDEDGFFVYRGEKFEHLLDAMRAQQNDAQAARAEKAARKTAGETAADNAEPEPADKKQAS